MGFYRNQLLPRFVDKACGTEGLAAWRRRCADGLYGTIVEPGFGSGHNIAEYPAGVTKVYAVDPAVVGRKLAADRLASSSVTVEFVGLDGQSIPLDDDSCDGGLVTFTLCTIPDASAALAELRRVIVPGGRLHFLEHGRAPDEKVARFQRRVDPMQKRLFDGCHLTRDIPGLIEAAGFDVDDLDARYGEGPKAWSYFYVGQAVNPG